MSYPPSMVHKSGNQLVVRSVVSGHKLFGSSEGEEDAENDVESLFSAIDSTLESSLAEHPEGELPQCKVKRNYACSSCSYYTQNPRYYLHHLKNVHKEKIRIYECPHCLYASKHSQKLQRHIHMVHVMGKRKMLIKTKTTPAAQKISVKAEPVVVVEANGHPLDEDTKIDKKGDTGPPQAASSDRDAEEVEETPKTTENQSDQPIKCSVCSFSSRNANLVTRHERLVHLKKKFYRCSKCDYITHMKARFTKHVKYHSMPMIKCEMCDFRTPYKWNLDRHNKNHFANGAFKCSQCNFTADIKQSLTVHEMNHHVPPVNGMSGTTIQTPLKRRCRVGASDIIDQEEASQITENDLDDLELLRMERESLTSQSSPPPDDELDESDITSEEAAQMTAVEITMVKPNVPSGAKSLNLKNPTAAAYFNGTLKPEDVILTKNGSVYVKKYKCRICQYKAAWESEMIRHELRVHGLDSDAKKKPPPRPLPNLIPIQKDSNSTSGSAATSPNRINATNSVSNSTNSVSNSLVNRMRPQSKTTTSLSPPRNGLLNELEYDKPLTEKDLNEIYNKSCATSSLKDFASLIGTDESTVKSDKFKDFMSMFADDKELENMRKNNTTTTTESAPVEDGQTDGSKKAPEVFKKKNASFFDRLKEKLMVGGSESHNLVCWCGHKSKCLSESVLHQKTHSEIPNDKTEKTNNGPMISGADLSSTRCQHCRQRCKTSSDLFAHLQSCPEIIKKGKEVENSEAAAISGNDSTEMEVDPYIKEEVKEEPVEFVEENEGEKGENPKVFVWNNFSQEKEDIEDYQEEFRSKSPASESSSLVGYEIAPGIGSIMPFASNPEDTIENFKELNIDVQNVETTTKKVFKCPTCTFWASTASRFHVHIVSHMNVKPFGCSVCPYQSKWKWDVTKHIKLKRERDPTHERAEMRTIDVETGRRNYTKYNRYLTTMRVHEPRHDLNTSRVPTTMALSPKLNSSVPVLPRLTPAPCMNGDVDQKGLKNELMTRPLPQLHPANPNVSKKRPFQDGGDSKESPKKKTPSEKKMWKCKKCKFRNTDRSVVLTHVKVHYENGSRRANDELGKAPSGNGHLFAKDTIKCDLCNFKTDNQGIFRVHSSHHVEDKSALFKCCFCPFFANEKPFMISHIASHGVNNAEETLTTFSNNEVDPQKLDLNDRTDSLVDDQNLNDLSDCGLNKSESLGDEFESHKRFRCGNCPYVTNNKSQYLYHKQFHKQRGAPFKCNICSYNVTKRHLLHQHLKIHGVKRAQFKNCVKDAVEKEAEGWDSFSLSTDIETSHMNDIPLVWVYKTGNLSKMFKCRHCPHVNLRKSNIHEHEKMHFDRVQRSPNGSVSGHQASTHHCTDCNYVCNNAGALASHFKVHQGVFGQICALADPRRSDESQIREITRLMKIDDRFKNIRDEGLKNLEKSPEMNRSEEAVQDSTISSLEQKQMLYFCYMCPSRFMCLKDLQSHLRFHGARHSHKCASCTYSASQQAQLMAHNRVHTNEYHEKTNMLMQKHEDSNDFPRPKTVMITEKPGFAGLGWVVTNINQKKDETKPAARSKVVTKQFSCHKCPARFFKSVALQHHLTLHGGKDQYQCRGCDYRVKTYGNLIKHEAVHNLEPRLKAKALKKKQHNLMKFLPQASVPASGTELLHHRNDQITKEQSGEEEGEPITDAATLAETSGVPTTPTLTADPEFGVLMHGSPDFIYPQTVKNGKLREKRYKCHKCPSAFEKREQYKTHVSLHGAKSRFKCQKCDYSVKYFANYTQHMRKHELNEKCQIERRSSTQSKSSDDILTEKLEEMVNTTVTSEEETAASMVGTSPEKSLPETPLPISIKAAKTLHISVADKQAVVLMQQKISEFGINMTDALHRCYYCPYSHMRRDAVESHERCHLNPKGSYICEFCNYTVPQLHFLREHQKLHFGPMKGIKPEAYMKCDRLEIWMETEEGKVLIFKDSGRKQNRFEPPVEVLEEDSEFQKIYVDVKTGEELVSGNVEKTTTGTVDLCSAASSPPMSLTKVKHELVEVDDVGEKIESLKNEPPEDEKVDNVEDLKGMKEVDCEDIGDMNEYSDAEAEMKSATEDECDQDNVEENKVDAPSNEHYSSDDCGDSSDVEVPHRRFDLLNRKWVYLSDTYDDKNMDVDEGQNECILTNGKMDVDAEDNAGIEEVDSDHGSANSHKVSQEDENTNLTNATKTVSDDSDSEDSDSSSSSSSCSGSGSSCSSSDSSDDEKENGVEEDSGTTDAKEHSFPAYKKD